MLQIAYSLALIFIFTFHLPLLFQQIIYLVHQAEYSGSIHGLYQFL